METGNAIKRFVVTDTELSAGFGAAGLAVRDAPIFRSLPDPGGHGPGSLLDQDGRLDPAAIACLSVLADAVLSLRMEHWPGNSAIALETYVLAAPVKGAVPVYVQFARPSEGQWDIALLGKREAAFAMLTHLVGSPAAASGIAAQPPVDFTLSLPALRVLAFLATYYREAHLLAAYFAGQKRRSETRLELTAQRMAQGMQDLATRADIGSPFARLAIATNGVLLHGIGETTVEQGTAALRAAGVLDDGFLPTPSGVLLLDHLRQGWSLTVLQVARRGSSGLELDSMVFHDGAAGRLAATWLMDESKQIAAVRLAIVNHEDCSHILDTMLALPIGGSY